MPDNVAIFLVIESLIIVSFVLFWSLISKATQPLLYVDLFKHIVKEQDFTTRFSRSGQNEIDELILLFNQMLQQLYQERIKLGDRQAMLQQLLDAIPLSIFVFDFDEKISQINPAAQQLFALDAASAMDKSLTSLNHPLLQQVALMEVGQSVVINLSSGQRFRCSLNRFVDRGFERRFCIIQELTQELRASERNTYHKLIRLMSHEVNNTMAATGSLLKSCLHYGNQIDQDDRDDYVTALKLVIERTDSLNEFMSDYAQVVRLPLPVLEQCNIRQLLLMTQKLLANELRQRNINFVISPDSLTDIYVLADQNQLERVFINIVKNAIEAIEKNGEICIEFTVNDNELILAVKDTGSGIETSKQQDLFTPFFTTKAQGQGIGLMLVAEILQAHQFDYNLSNRLDSSGAVFSITFPLI